MKYITKIYLKLSTERALKGGQENCQSKEMAVEWLAGKKRPEAVGPGGVKPKTMQGVLVFIKDHLWYRIFHGPECLQSQRYQIGEVQPVLLYKDKGSTSECSSYRGISLLSLQEKCMGGF